MATVKGSPVPPDTAQSVREEPVKLEYDVKAAAIDAKRFVEREFGESDYFTSVLIAEVMREEFSLFMAEKIQKNKESNLKMAKEVKRGD
jgi:hypothetical protein